MINQEKVKSAKIDNQENCGSISVCEDMIFCQFGNLDSVPCHYRLGYESEDCLLNKDTQARIDKKNLLQNKK
ncbi:MAG: hypothetical protein NT091_02970 [Candidatus Falkowbacteria bacterium]|nr:hypothetical protein [Candidatus Falkowbacteria bacterium]